MIKNGMRLLGKWLCKAWDDSMIKSDYHSISCSVGTDGTLPFACYQPSESHPGNILKADEPKQRLFSPRNV